MMDSPHLNKKKPLAILHLMRCSIGIFRELTLEDLAMFDVGQNISNLKENSNAISRVYREMGRLCRVFAAGIGSGKTHPTGDTVSGWLGALTDCASPPGAGEFRFMPRRDGIPWWNAGRRSAGYRLRLAPKAYPARGYRLLAFARRHKKKGAQRAPLTPTESLWATARSHHHKTRCQYGYLSRAAP
jgi:hypothetical protein